MPLWSFVCDPGISKCVLSSNDPGSNLSLFYSIPKVSEGCENRPVESHASAASCITVGPLPVTHENAILSSVHFFCQPVMYFLVLLILKTMNYTWHTFSSPVFAKSQELCCSRSPSPRQKVLVSVAVRCQDSPVTTASCRQRAQAFGLQVLAGKLGL